LTYSINALILYGESRENVGKKNYSIAVYHELSRIYL